MAGNESVALMMASSVWHAALFSTASAPLADAVVPPWAQLGLGLLAANLALLVLLLHNLRALVSRFGRSEAQRERREADERRLVAVRALRHDHDRALVGAAAAIGGKAPLEVSQLGRAIDALKQLAHDAKWTEAGDLLAACIELIRSAKGAPPTDLLGMRLAECLAPGGPLYDVAARSATCKAALADLNSDASWTLSSHRDGTRVQYRRTERTLAIKVDALVEGVRPADALYVWRETSVYKEWFPLVTASTELCEVSEAESVLHLEMDAWFAYNDMAMRGWGCDCLKDGYLLMVVRPVTQADVPAGVTIPPMEPTRRLFPSTRVVAEINILVEPLSASAVRFAYSLAVPLAPSVPLWVVNVVLQQGVANIFASMREQARRMSAGDPSSAHLRAMQTPRGRRLASWLADKVDPYVAALEGRA